MLDPVIALGVASNVVQFIDFGFKLVSKSVEVYRNRDLLQHGGLREHVDQLVKFNLALKQKFQYFQREGQISEERSNNKPEPTDEIELLLRSAVDHCISCAGHLMNAINKLPVLDSHAKWQSFRHALCSMLGKSGLDATTQKLFQAQQNVNLFLLLYTRWTSTLQSHRVTLTCYESTQDTSRILDSHHLLGGKILQAINDSTGGLREQVRAIEEAFKQTEMYGIDTKNNTKRLYNIEKIEDFVRKSRNENSALFRIIDEDLYKCLPDIARHRFVATLDFDRIDDRYDRIEEAHRKTLQWILQPDERRNTVDSFPSWLEAEASSGSVYWITGVPGSGKSTLMRYLSDSNCVKETLQQMNPSRAICILRCFFWHPGTQMQRSMEGLLRTLAHQAILDGYVEDSIIYKSFPLQWQSCMYDHNPAVHWSIPELLILFREILEALSQRFTVMLFIDGLDEFGVDRQQREDLVNYLVNATSQLKVKMCLSSRPWNEFKDRLGAYPHIKLEEINKEDMDAFVGAELAHSRAFQDLADISEDAKNDVFRLFEQLVTKSSGVWLWLRLVSRRLKNAAQDGKPLRKLRDTLDEIPPDLNDFFKHMLERIPDQDRVQASKVFQIVVDDNAACLPDLMMLSFTDEQDDNFALSPAMGAESPVEILSRPVALRRRINSQCMDLLICPPRIKTKRADRCSVWDDTSVEYLHRTVRDFLISRTSLDVLENHTDGPFDRSWYKCNAALAQMGFINKLISSSCISLRDTGSLLGHFSVCVSRLRSSSKATDSMTMSIFEHVVDCITPLSANYMRISESLGLEQVFTKTTIKYSSAGTDQVSDWREKELFKEALNIYNTYMEDRASISEQNRFLLMAVLADLRQHARYYLADVANPEDMWAIFHCALVQSRWNARGIDLELLALISERGRCFNHSQSASKALARYHNRADKRSGPAWGPEDAEVTRLLLEKTAGTVGSRSELKHFQDTQKRKIQELYTSQTRDSLLRGLQSVRQTWKPIDPGLASALRKSTAANSQDKTQPATPPAALKYKLSIRKALLDLVP